ncbi:MAG: hypothetical protein JNM80_08485 [Phycisphaerae bacterium]|nr:hypothetical protein [Phycisphaerae bacterium]
MRLSDIMSQMGLTVWPEAALVIFAGVFVLIVRRVLSRDRAAEMASAARLPLEDGTACEKETGR